MTGWRCAAIVGNADAIAEFGGKSTSTGLFEVQSVVSRLDPWTLTSGR